jgi:hypothetical protein
MSNGPTSTDGRHAELPTPPQTGADPESPTGPELHLAVVQYEDKPDLGTIYPPGLSGVERMDTWISATMAEFVDLDAWR